MIKFFREIRQKLVSENKLSKYLLYAVGEIVLVVLGILIALQINNWNEKRKNQSKVNELLVKVREELALNIDRTNDLIQRYRKRDTLFYDVLHKKVTLENYASNSRLRGLVFNYSTANISDAAVLNLKQYSEQLSTTQENLITRINSHYYNNKKDIDDFDLAMEEATRNLIDKLKNEKEWYASISIDPNSEAFLQYLLTDPIYLNHVATYEILGLRNHLEHVIDFNYDGKDLYSDLSRYLGMDMDTLLFQNPLAFKHLIGTYHLIDSENKETFVIKQQNGDLVYEWINNTGKGTLMLFPDTENEFIAGYRFASLIRDENNEITGMIRTLGSLPKRIYTKEK